MRQSEPPEEVSLEALVITRSETISIIAAMSSVLLDYAELPAGTFNGQLIMAALPEEEKQNVMTLKSALVKICAVVGAPVHPDIQSMRMGQ